MPPKSQQRALCEEITSSFSTNHPCAQWFASIEGSVRELAKQVENVALDVKFLTEKVLQQEMMIKLWKEEFFPQVKEVPDKISEEIEDHEAKCLARRRAQLQAEDITGVVKVPMKESRMPEKPKGFTIPKVVIYIGVVLGTAIAIGGYVLAYLFDKFQ